MNNSTTSYAGYNAGFQLGQNVGGQINNNYYNQLDNSKAINPELDKQRIEKEKGGLLRDSYCWVLDNDDFKKWRDTTGTHLLWIKGDPGKGKTMLVCGVINELSKHAIPNKINIAYFFCQATNDRINSATAVLQGLIFMLGRQQPSLQSHIPAKFLDNENGWYELGTVFQKIFQDPAMKCTYLLIDALDECTVDQDKLLDFLEEESSRYQHVKWIVSSRNWPSIEKSLDNTTGIRLQLELDKDNLAAAVDYFIKYKVEELSKRNRYTLENRQLVENHLLLNAKGTFLWVALVCKQLKDISARHLQKKLEDFPPGLDEFYHRMFNNIQDSNDDLELCLSLLGIITTVYRPITMDELSIYLESQDEIAHEDLKEIVNLCGSFLTLQNQTITLVHQSAQDFLLKHAPHSIAPYGIQEIHYFIFSKSLGSLSTKLQRNIYNLRDPAVSINQVNQPDPDPLAKIRYACVHWTDHLNDYFRNKEKSVQISDTILLDTFLRQNLLHWLEALSLIRDLSGGANSMLRLGILLKTRTRDTNLVSRVQDAYRFIVYHRGMVENYPLQVYTSAVFFSPQGSITRSQFEPNELAWISGKLVVGQSWGLCLQTLQNHNDSVSFVVFSPDSVRLASASQDRTIKLWDADSGKCLQILEDQHNSIGLVVFSPDSARLASVFGNYTINLYNASNGVYQETLPGHDDPINLIVFSPDSMRLASASDDRTIKLWDIRSSKCLYKLEGHCNSVKLVIFSHDSKWLASASEDKTIKLWDVRRGKCLRTLDGHQMSVKLMIFSHKSTQLTSASNDNTIKLWDLYTGRCLQTLKGHDSWTKLITFSYDSILCATTTFSKTVELWDLRSGERLNKLVGHENFITSVVFSHDSTRLASASFDMTIMLWDVRSGNCLHTLVGHEDLITSVVFSHDSTRLASASCDKTIKLWDARNDACEQILEGHTGSVDSATYSHDFTQFASASYHSIKIWDARSGTCLQNLRGHSDLVKSVIFSHDSTQLASASDDRTIKLWNVRNGAYIRTLVGHEDFVTSVVFSHDSTRLASASFDKTIKLWNASNGTCLRTLTGHEGFITSVVFSHDSTRLASASFDKTIKLWNASNGTCLQTLAGHDHWITSVVFSFDSSRLASADFAQSVKLWDADRNVCLHTMKNCGNSVLKYDILDSYVQTDRGHLIVPVFAYSDLSPEHTEEPYPTGFGLSCDRTWITWNSAYLLKLPSAYSVSTSIIAPSTILLGFTSGRVCILLSK